MRFSTFFIKYVLSPAPEQWVSHWGRYEFFAKVYVDNRNLMFISGDLFTCVNDTGEKLSPVSLTPVINICIRISPQTVKRQKGSNRLLMGLGETDFVQKNLKLKISCKTSFKNLRDWRRTGTDFSPHYLKSPMESRRYICGSCRE